MYMYVYIHNRCLHDHSLHFDVINLIALIHMYSAVQEVASCMTHVIHTAATRSSVMYSACIYMCM